MAKRRRKKPNLPQSVIEDARQDAIADSPNAPAEAKETAEKLATESQSKSRRSRRRDIQAATLEKRKGSDALPAEYVAEMLANPTKIVTEEDLRADYGFVIKDLRNMGILAAVLFVFLIGVSVTFL